MHRHPMHHRSSRGAVDAAPLRVRRMQQPQRRLATAVGALLVTAAVGAGYVFLAHGTERLMDAAGTPPPLPHAASTSAEAIRTPRPLGALYDVDDTIGNAVAESYDALSHHVGTSDANAANSKRHSKRDRRLIRANDIAGMAKVIAAQMKSVAVTETPPTAAPRRMVKRVHDRGYGGGVPEGGTELRFHDDAPKHKEAGGGKGDADASAAEGAPGVVLGAVIADGPGVKSRVIYDTIKTLRRAGVRPTDILVASAQPAVAARTAGFCRRREQGGGDEGRASSRSRLAAERVHCVDWHQLMDEAPPKSDGGGGGSGVRFSSGGGSLAASKQAEEGKKDAHLPAGVVPLAFAEHAYHKDYLEAFERGVKMLAELSAPAGDEAQRDPAQDEGEARPPPPTHYLFATGFLTPAPWFGPRLASAVAANPHAVVGCSWVAPAYTDNAEPSQALNGMPDAAGAAAPREWVVLNHGYHVDYDYRDAPVLSAVLAGLSPWDRRVAGAAKPPWEPAPAPERAGSNGNPPPLVFWGGASAAQQQQQQGKETDAEHARTHTSVDVVSPQCVVVPKAGLEAVQFETRGTAGSGRRGLSPTPNSTVCEAWALTRRVEALLFAGNVLFENRNFRTYVPAQRKTLYEVTAHTAKSLAAVLVHAHRNHERWFKGCPTTTPEVAAAEAYESAALRVAMGAVRANDATPIALFNELLPVLVDATAEFVASKEKLDAMMWGALGGLAPTAIENAMAFLIDVAEAQRARLRDSPFAASTGFVTATGAQVACCSFDANGGIFPDAPHRPAGGGAADAPVLGGTVRGRVPDQRGMPDPYILHPHLPTAGYGQALFATRLTTAYKEVFAARDGRKLAGLAVFYQGHCCKCCGFSNEWLRYMVALERRVRMFSNTGGHCHCAGVPVSELHAVDRLYIKDPAVLPVVPAGDVVVTIAHTPPDGYEFQRKLTRRFARREAEYFVGRSMYEFDTIPAEWVDMARAGDVDEIWVPTEFGKRAFVDSGVQPAKIVIIPEALDTAFYDPAAATPLRRLPEHWRAWSNHAGVSSDFRDLSAQQVFLSVFKWEPRKGPEVLLETFIATFATAERKRRELGDQAADSRPVTLLILTWRWAADYGPKATPEEQQAYQRNLTWFAEHVTRAARAVGSGDATPQIVVVTEEVSEVEMRDVYAGADAFVLPTRGEGWGLPIMQAMSMGMPTITTDWGGATQFITPRNAYPIRVAAVADISDEAAVAYNLEGARWAEVDRADLSRLLLEVYHYPAAAQKRGAVARHDVVRHFGQEAVAATILERLKYIKANYAALVARRGGDDASGSGSGTEAPPRPT